MKYIVQALICVRVEKVIDAETIEDVEQKFLDLEYSKDLDIGSVDHDRYTEFLEITELE